MRRGITTLLLVDILLLLKVFRSILQTASDNFSPKCCSLLGRSTGLCLLSWYAMRCTRWILPQAAAQRGGRAGRTAAHQRFKNPVSGESALAWAWWNLHFLSFLSHWGKVRSSSQQSESGGQLVLPRADWLQKEMELCVLTCCAGWG